jgi:hypothetical protein
MDDVEGLSEATLERLLAGRAPADEDTLGLSRFAEDLRAAFVTAPATEVEEQHLAAMVDAARLHPDQTQPSAVPVFAGLAALLTTWRRKVVLSGFFGTLTAKIVAGTVVATAATGGLAAGNLLPAPVQQAVAGAAGAVGIDLPMPGGPAVAAPAVDAGKAAEATQVLDALVKQVTDGAAQPHEVGLPIAEAAQACATQVATLARELAETAAGTTDPAQALSLAERAAAIAHEAVGCAMPKPAAAGTTGAAGAIVATSTGAEAIVDAVRTCVEELKPGIMQLVQSALRSMDPSAAAALASEAGAVAGRAGECAGSVGAAAQTAFALPIPVPIAGIPNLPAIAPRKQPVPVPVAPAPQPEATTPAAGSGSLTPSWWEAPAGTSTNPAEAWMGMTGSWGDFAQWMPSGSWNPFAPAPQPSPTN